MAGFTVTLEAVDCASCRMTFGISEHFMADRRRDHGTFYCPVGHSNVFPGKSTEDKLREQLTAARELAEREATRRRLADDRAKSAHQRAAQMERSRTAYRGHVTRLKARVAAGLCPYCSQSFPDLAAHVHDYHGQ